MSREARLETTAPEPGPAPYSIGAQREARRGTAWTPTVDKTAALGITGTTEGLVVHVHAPTGKHTMLFDWDQAQTITSTIRNARRNK